MNCIFLHNKLAKICLESKKKLIIKKKTIPISGKIFIVYESSGVGIKKVDRYTIISEHNRYVCLSSVIMSLFR